VVLRAGCNSLRLLVVSGLTRLIAVLDQTERGSAIGRSDMTLPQIIVDLMKLLFDMEVPAAICTMVLAGISCGTGRRRELPAGGGFSGGRFGR